MSDVVIELSIRDARIIRDQMRMDLRRALTAKSSYAQTAQGHPDGYRREDAEGMYQGMLEVCRNIERVTDIITKAIDDGR